VFPASSLGGPSYIKQLLAPLPHLELCPTGGIHVENFTAYLDAGARVVGIGDALTNAPEVKAAGPRALTWLASTMRSLVHLRR
jgi:2-dehydro-3-deoxyphosphogluconate aldolase/(4S)-4-hydroxy-2-oxoglutarate aldolase